MTHRPLKRTADGSLTAIIWWVESDFGLMMGPVEVHEYDVGTLCAKAGPARTPRKSRPQSAAARFTRHFMENSLKRAEQFKKPIPQRPCCGGCASYQLAS